MTLIAKPVRNTRRVGRGSSILARDQNDTVAALFAIQQASNQIKAGNARAWSETMLHRIELVRGDYLECVRVWRGGNTFGTEVVYVARPRLLRTSITSRDGVTYAYSSDQKRTASKAGEDDEEHVVTPVYLAGDFIEVVSKRGSTGIPEVDQQRAILIDKNVDGRAWAVEPT